MAARDEYFNHVVSVDGLQVHSFRGTDDVISMDGLTAVSIPNWLFTELNENSEEDDC